MRIHADPDPKHWLLGRGVKRAVKLPEGRQLCQAQWTTGNQRYGRDQTGINIFFYCESRNKITKKRVYCTQYSKSGTWYQSLRGFLAPDRSGNL
jgi:hypothetical protein